MSADLIARGIAEGFALGLALLPPLRRFVQRLIRAEFQAQLDAENLPCRTGTPAPATSVGSEESCSR